MTDVECTNTKLNDVKIDIENLEKLKLEASKHLKQSND